MKTKPTGNLIHIFSLSAELLKPISYQIFICTTVDYIHSCRNGEEKCSETN
jgi:hypothetical protein